MKIAVEGCCHGELDAIYARIAELERTHAYTVDALLVCGDFQAIRNERDLQCMAVPDKYRRLGEFAKYYSGEKRAPMLTIVIGGNHEASNYLWELYHGGWLAPNIYFLGHAGCVQLHGVRIAGASGIFKAHDFNKGHYERLPYSPGAMRSIYHIREYNVRRLSLLPTLSPTLFLSHDWPASIEHHGDLPALLRTKPFFRADVQSGRLGSPPLMGLLRTLRPAWWFAAHLHVRFEARVGHGDGNGRGDGGGDGGMERRGLGERGRADELRHDGHAGQAVAGEKQGGWNPDEIEIDAFDEAEEVVGLSLAAEPALTASTSTSASAPAPAAGKAKKVEDPDEIVLDDFVGDDDDVPAVAVAGGAKMEVEVVDGEVQAVGSGEGVVEERAVPDAASVADPAVTAQDAKAKEGNPDEIALDDLEDEVEAPHPPPLPPSAPVSAPGAAHGEASSPELGQDGGAHETRFLALDKCLPKRRFLEVIDVPIPSSFKPPPSSSPPSPTQQPIDQSGKTRTPPVLTFDPTWLAITRAFAPYMSVSHAQQTYPPEAEARAAVASALEWVGREVYGGDLSVGKRVEDVQQFCVVAPRQGDEGSLGRQQPPHYGNPQTAAFCAMLGIENKVDVGR